jgi:D-cysteine desulfhydrase
VLDRPIFDAWPRLKGRVPWVELGDWPTPVESLAPVMAAIGARTEAFIKRDDVSSPVYGGNKVRTLEVLFAQAKAEGATHIYSTGAFGSNHAAATVLHAPRAGLVPGVVLFPQPASAAALENIRVIAARSRHNRALLHWSGLPFGMAAARRAHRNEERAFVMVPGGATPHGALGYVSAALELAHQVRRGELPAPERIVIGVGSTCTSAGLLVGLHHAARLGIGFAGRPPQLVSVRVTPWPITSPIRIARLAAETSDLLAELASDRSLAIPYRELRERLTVDGRFLGWGYGRPTKSGREAIELFRARADMALDTTYSAKSAAALLAGARAGGTGPVLYWSTKSTVPLPDVHDGELEGAPPGMRRFIERCRRG